MKKINYRKLFTEILILALISSAAYFLIFKNLGKFQIRMWDEATYANNSIDMFLSNKNIFEVDKFGKPDLFNSKPPFVIWLQALSMKFIGINELAVRLPSGIFSLLTILMVYFFCKRVFKNRVIGIVSAGVLLTANGYIHGHVALTGDLDAVLVFWLTLGLFTFIDLMVAKPNNPKSHFIILVLSIFFGVLTKGTAGFFFLPFFLIITFVFGNQKIYKEKWLYISSAITLILCGTYYFIRESFTPGYINLVIESELFRYTHVVMKWHIYPFDYYYQNLKNTRFTPYFTLLPFAFMNILLYKYKSDKFLVSFYLAITAIGYLILISYPNVKMVWYDAPMFPILSILIGLLFVQVIDFVFDKIRFKIPALYAGIISTIVAGLLFIKPYKDILKKNRYPERGIFSMELDGAYLKHIKTNEPEIKELTVFKKVDNEAHYDQVLFYIRAYEYQNNYHIRLSHEMDFNNKELVMACKQEDKVDIQAKYEVKELNTWESCSLYQIEQAK